VEGPGNVHPLVVYGFQDAGDGGGDIVMSVAIGPHLLDPAHVQQGGDGMDNAPRVIQARLEDMGCRRELRKEVHERPDGLARMARRQGRTKKLRLHGLDVDMAQAPRLGRIDEAGSFTHEEVPSPARLPGHPSKDQGTEFAGIEDHDLPLLPMGDDLFHIRFLAEGGNDDHQHFGALDCRCHVGGYHHRPGESRRGPGGGDPLHHDPAEGLQQLQVCGMLRHRRQAHLVPSQGQVACHGLSPVACSKYGNFHGITSFFLV